MCLGCNIDLKPPPSGSFSTSFLTGYAAGRCTTDELFIVLLDSLCSHHRMMVTSMLLLNEKLLNKLIV